LGWTGFFEPIVAAQHLDRAVRDHFVGIHVRLRAGARLPDDQRKIVVELAVDHFLGGRLDGLRQLRIELAQRHIGDRGRALDDAQRMDDRRAASARRRS
jgi:hypothetical protein